MFSQTSNGVTTVGRLADKNILITGGNSGIGLAAIEGETPEVVRVSTDCGRWLADSRIPKLFINAEPGAVLTGRRREFCRTWRNQTEVTVEGIHFIQEDSPEEIGEAVAGFVRSLRSI